MSLTDCRVVAGKACRNAHDGRIVAILPAVDGVNASENVTNVLLIRTHDSTCNDNRTQQEDLAKQDDS